MRYRFLAFIFPLILAGCSTGRNPWEDSEGKTRVLASFPPLYCFAAAVGGEHVDALCLLTATGPHHYEATASDSRKVAGADLFLINGLVLDEKFSHKLLLLARNKTLKPIQVGAALDKSLLAKGLSHEGHQHGEFDPHVWLGPAQAQAMVDVVAKTLSEREPAHAADFQKNAAAYKAKISELHDYGRARFKDKKSKSLVTQHESLRYFADGFGLDLIDSIQVQPEIEPDAPHLAKLAETCREKGVKLIAVEPQFGRQNAETLARLLRAKGSEVKIVSVDPIETATPGTRGNPDRNLYLDQMKANINTIAEALP